MHIFLISYVECETNSKHSFRNVRALLLELWEPWGGGEGKIVGVRANGEYLYMIH